MSNIKFVSHEFFPEDQYHKELVYLTLDDKYRVAYVRKQAKSGGLFWTGVTVGIVKNQNKVYFEAFLQDSAFMEKDIRSFLEARSWETTPSKSINEKLPNISEDVPF